MTTAGIKQPIKDRLLACLASGTVTKGYVAISDGLDVWGEQKAKVSNSAGLVIPIGIFDHDMTDGKTVDVQVKGRVICVSGGALATLYTPVSYTNAGKVKAAAAGEYVIGHNVSTCTAADEAVSIELEQGGIKA
jgi:hypothetical protein